jgi:hypothetical protein
MKTAKYFIRIMILFIFGISFYSCLAIVPVDVVMIDDELFFVLEKKHEIDYLEVSEAKAAPGTASKSFWLLGYDASTPVKSRKYLELSQIRYGKKYDGFSVVKGPFPLRKNIEYLVKINMPGKFAIETFVITDDGKAIMPHPTFERQKNRTYSVSVDKNGNKTLILEPVSK